MRDERTIMAAVIAGGICAHGNAGVTSKPALVADNALAVADAIIAKCNADEAAADKAEHDAYVARQAAKGASDRTDADTDPTTDGEPA